jgi:hypothetical protein
MAADRYGLFKQCLFIEEAAFHINMERSVAWSKVGTRAEVVSPKTRAKTTTILGAVCFVGVINVKVRRPRALIQNKKKKSSADAAAGKTQGGGGTVTNITSTLYAIRWMFWINMLDLRDIIL